MHPSTAAPTVVPSAAPLPRDGWVELTAPGELTELLGAPHPIVIEKVHDRLTEEDLRLIGQSPLCTIATSDAAGNCDASPKGGEPGFTLVLDERTLALPDLPGNRRSDGFRNILQNPHVGLLYFIPGVMDVLRVNGRARVLRDAPFFGELADAKGARPQLALLVEIDEIFRHCPASLRRSGVWKPDTWGAGAPPAIPGQRG
ncbi:pyridoxamine 5'-phosphate oxidase family protein [Streptomyces sp. NBC_00247]|uniref:MSMEG_1061 family FMN-dependent PPOX-type flavoprotein n=1 Tax=Streptomyces sp. NBC_00247 TaxID=2975689 RepID=UPI002E294595|nr:MSMEG_1061 family FMN-dependent PPOX-type flavoprotein [Streptomyces sp. NBC_00247]